MTWEWIGHVGDELTEGRLHLAALTDDRSTVIASGLRWLTRCGSGPSYSRPAFRALALKRTPVCKRCFKSWWRDAGLDRTEVSA